MLALNFFSPLANGDMRVAIGKPKLTTIQPLSGQDFLTYLKNTGKLDETDRYMYLLEELLANLAEAKVLKDSGNTGAPFLGSCYYFLKELTSKQREGLLWLAPAFGAEFIRDQFASITVQLVGHDKHGDACAGTGLVVAPNWLLTCGHVLKDMRPDDLQTLGNSQFSIIRTLTHQLTDVGLLEVAPSLPMLGGLSFRDPRIGEDVFTLGYPRIPLSKDSALVMHKGDVTCDSLTTFANHELFLYSAIARPGNSGGPIIASSGHVVGIVTEQLSEEAPGHSLPFYAGVRTTEIADAIHELVPSLSLPIEDYS